MKGIKKVWTCGPSLKLYMRVRLNWIPSGVFYGEKISSLKLKSGGYLGYYIERFRGLAILWREIDTNFQP